MVSRFNADSIPGPDSAQDAIGVCWADLNKRKPRSFDAGAERTELFDHGIPYRRAHVAMGIRCDTSVFDKTRQANGHSMKRVMILCLSAVKEIVLHVGVGTVVYFLLCLYRWITFFSFVSIIVSITVFVK